MQVTRVQALYAEVIQCLGGTPSRTRTLSLLESLHGSRVRTLRLPDRPMGRRLTEAKL